jgi:hypothetical protein
MPVVGGFDAVLPPMLACLHSDENDNSPYVNIRMLISYRLLNCDMKSSHCELVQTRRYCIMRQNGCTL